MKLIKKEMGVLPEDFKDQLSPEVVQLALDQLQAKGLIEELKKSETQVKIKIEPIGV